MSHTPLPDSKTLTPEKRAELLGVLNSDAHNLGWSVRVIRYGHTLYLLQHSHGD